MKYITSTEPVETVHTFEITESDRRLLITVLLNIVPDRISSTHEQLAKLRGALNQAIL